MNLTSARSGKQFLPKSAFPFVLALLYAVVLGSGCESQQSNTGAGVLKATAKQANKPGPEECPKDCRCTCPSADGTCPRRCCECPGGIDEPVVITGGSLDLSVPPPTRPFSEWGNNPREKVHPVAGKMVKCVRFAGDQNFSYTFEGAKVTLKFFYGDVLTVTTDTNPTGRTLRMTADETPFTSYLPNGDRELRHPVSKSLTKVQLISNVDIPLADGTVNPANTPIDHPMRMGSVTIHYMPPDADEEEACSR